MSEAAARRRIAPFTVFSRKTVNGTHFYRIIHGYLPIYRECVAQKLH